MSTLHPHGRVIPKRRIFLVLMTLAVIALTTFLTTKGSGRAGGALIPRKSRMVWNGNSTGNPGSSSRAEARFELDNVGDETVRVLAVESGCGCARPTVHPSVIPPGRSATVDVLALTVSVGYKDVRFTIHTDSTKTPEVLLTLRIMGTRKPPFLFMFWGDLQFRGTYSSELSRMITVATVEPRNQQDHPALEVYSDLPFLEIVPAGIEDQPYANADAILHKRRFKVRFKARPAGAFEGTIIAKDPWDPRGTKTLAVAGKFDSGMTVTPGRITFAGSKGGRGEPHRHHGEAGHGPGMGCPGTTWSSFEDRGTRLGPDRSSS